MKVCQEKYENRTCVLECYHSSYCQDETGFKFYIQHLSNGEKIYYPDRMGNAPNGYPMNNKAFDQLAENIIDKNKDNIKQAKDFQNKLANSFKKNLI